MTVVFLLKELLLVVVVQLLFDYVITKDNIVNVVNIECNIELSDGSHWMVVVEVKERRSISGRIK
jgi:hypothetical protein